MGHFVVPDNLRLRIMLIMLGYLVCTLCSITVLSLSSVASGYLILSVLLISAAFFLAFTAFGRGWAALLSVTFAVFLAYYADSCVFSARLTHVRVSDFALVGQAMGVASHYSLVWTREQAWRLALVVSANAGYCLLCREAKETRPTRRTRAVAGALALASLTGLGIATSAGLVQFGQEGFDTNDGFRSTGLLGSWACQIANRNGERPEGYERRVAETALASYEGDHEEAAPDLDVYVIMNESLADYSLVGEAEFADPLPGVHELVASGRAFEGRVGVSVFGGGTCNTEWEFLTGNSLAFLPQDSHPFLSYVDRPSESLASDLERLGFHTSFLHPYLSEEWNRRAVYSFFGFDSFTGGEDMDAGLLGADGIDNATSVQAMDFGDDLEYVRDFVSDRQAYDYMLRDKQGVGGCRARFSFCVTMQNHGGYDYGGERFETTAYVPDEVDATRETAESIAAGMAATPSAANQYLTLSNISDEAFCELVDRLRSSDRDALVLMFGDHQPAVAMDRYVSYDPELRRELGEELHVVPYVVWSNRGVPCELPPYISANYLSAVLKECAGLPLTAWDKLRLDVMTEYPVLTTSYVLDSDGTPVAKDGSDLLRRYAYVQYMRLFDS